MIEITSVKESIEKDPQNWAVYLMDFVDDFRRNKDLRALSNPFSGTPTRWDALLASTATCLCQELNLAVPEWVEAVPSCQVPWFVSGKENLKAIALVQSPLPFRLRKIFVLENFLSRV